MYSYNNDDLTQDELNQFKCIKEDKYFINNTRKDFLLIYPDGSMTISMSRLKFHNNIASNKDDVITLEMDGSVVPNSVKEYTESMNAMINTQINEMTYGCPQLIEKYYYGIDGENVGEYREIPTEGKPVLIKSSVTFLLLLYDDTHSIERACRDILKSGTPKKYIENFLSDEFHQMGVGVRYINFSPFDLYYASHDNRQVSMLRHMRREEAIRFIQKSRDWTVIDNFTAELEEGNFIILGIIENGKLRLHKFEREENSTLASGSVQFADMSRSQEIIPIFYRRRDADIFLEDYDANISNVYLDAAVAVSDRRTSEAVEEEVQLSKKNMTAVAKVCAAMVTTGVAYGVGRAAIEAIVKSKTKKASAAFISNKIIRHNMIGNMIRKSVVPSLGKKAVMYGSCGVGGISSAFASPLSVGVNSVAKVIGSCVPFVIAGALIITAGILIYKNRDKISDFIEDHPVLEKVVDGLKLAGTVALGIVVAPVAAVCWVAKKAWEGVKRIGSWILGNLLGFCI